MFFHLIFAGFGLLGPVMLVYLALKRRLRDAPHLMFGVISGPFCGAGVAMGLSFQSTTANIHSGYSFAVVIDWLTIGATGGVVGLAAGVVLAQLASSWRPALAVFLVFGIAGATGWVVAAARPEIDCDDNPAFCSTRYD